MKGSILRMSFTLKQLLTIERKNRTFENRLFNLNCQFESLPIDKRPLHARGCLLKFAQQSEQHLAIIGQPGNTLKVVHTIVKQPVINSALKCVGGLSWHHRLPYVCVGVDRSLCLWKVAIN